MTRRLNFKCSKSKTLFTSAAIAMILTSISAQEVQAAKEIYYDEVTAEVATESTGVVEQGTLDTSISSDEGRAVEDTLVNVQVDSVGQDSEISLNPLTGNEEVSVQIEENSTVQPVIEAPETSTVTIEEEEEIVCFEDEVLANFIKKQLGLKYTAEINISDLHSLISLDLHNTPPVIADPYNPPPAPAKVRSLVGLEEAKNLRSLNMTNQHISNLTPLSNLQSLTEIYLSGNQVTDISSLTNLPSLRILNLSDNNIIDVRVFSNFPSLRNLYLDDNQINDISGLLNMPSLERLSLSNNNITDISGLSDLPSLRELYLADNQINDISHLEKLTSLKRLTLNNNNIEDISVLENFSALQSVSLFDNNISDISVLPHLNLGRELDLSNNKIIDITPLESLGFTERLNLSNNDITTINSLKKLGYIKYLDLSNNNVSDLEVLLDLPFLRSVNLENNNIIDDKQTIIALVNREVAIQHNSIKEDHQYERTEIPLEIIYVENPNIFIGREVVSQYGEYGYHQLVEIVTTFDGEEIKRETIDDYYRKPKDRIIQIGTKEITSEDLVYFEDEVLATLIKKQLGLKSTDDIIISDMHSLTYLELYGDHKIITSLTGLEEARNLHGLRIRDHSISDITPLSDLQSLEYIYLSGNQINDISSLANLKSLRELDLNNNQITDISGLVNLPSLTRLYLSNNNITNISVLENLPSLYAVSLSGNNLSNIDILSQLSLLESIDLSNNNITNISALSNLPLGGALDLSNNNISDITPLKSLEFIDDLDLSHNNLSDISPLKNLGFITRLNLSNNNVSDIEVLLDLPLLHSVNLENNYLLDHAIILDLLNNNIEVEHQDIDYKYEYPQTEIPFETIYVEDYNLSLGTEIVYQEGKNGIQETDIRVTTLGGIEINREVRYVFVKSNPIHQVIRRGTKPLDNEDAGVIITEETRTEEIPFETEYIDYPELPIGTTEILQEGINGLRKIVERITLVNNEEVSREVVFYQNISTPVNKQILVGTKDDNEEVPEQENEWLKFIDVSVAKEEYLQGEPIYLTVKLAAETPQEYSLDYVELYFDPEIIDGNPHQFKEGVYFDFSLFTLDKEGNHIASMPIRLFEDSGTYNLISGVAYDYFGNTASIGAKDFPIEFTVHENPSNTWPESYEDLYYDTGITAYADNMYRSDLQMMASNVTNDFPEMPREELGSNYALYDIHFVDGMFYEKTDVNIPITVTIPYSSTLNPENLYYFGENFELVQRLYFTDNGDSITFETDTFKYFGIQFADLKSDEEKEDTTTKEETRTEKVPFKTERVNNPDLLVGTEKVSQEGVDGVRTIVERVTLVNGKETKREVISNKITLDSVNKIIQVGTKAKEDDKNDGSKKDEDDKEKLVTAKVERHEGADREAVAIDVAEKHFSEAKKVIIVNQDKFPDAISATNISQGNFPVLYTRADKLGQATIDFMSSMKSLDEIYLLGGSASISEAIETLLFDKFGDVITRIDGETRFDANANAIRESYKKADHIIIATGETYTDALYGVSYADTLGAPIILSKTDRLVDASIALLKDLGVKQATIIGGVNSVTKDVEAQLKALGITVNPRIAGKTRYDSSVQVAKSSYKQPSTLLIASGDTFTDALVSAPLAQKLDVPILLVRKDSMVDEVRAYLESHAGSVETIYIQGGPHTISKANEAAIVKAVKPADKPKKAASKSRAHLSKTKEGNISTSEQVLSGLAYRGEEAKDEGVFNRNYSL